MTFGTSNDSLLMFLNALFTKIPTFYLIEIFAPHTQRRLVNSRHGYIFPVDMTTKHKERRYTLLSLASV